MIKRPVLTIDSGSRERPTLVGFAPEAYAEALSPGSDR